MDIQPEYALACAVVEQAMSELTSRNPQLRRRAREDIDAGGLDYWIYQVAGDEEMLRRIKDRLAEVLAGAGGTDVLPATPCCP